ncbi:hypothetical protein RND81_04G086300 [Saponaria officinalis]|uniref:Secreted protein n=1 Tax=Saponaria officinalis TaxID=3572 RepID=A0AAW1LD93_SAPOF
MIYLVPLLALTTFVDVASYCGCSNRRNADPRWRYSSETTLHETGSGLFSGSQDVIHQLLLTNCFFVMELVVQAVASCENNQNSDRMASS